MPEPNNDDMEAEFHLPGIQDLINAEMYATTRDVQFRSALITGCPGSGKTTVALHRLVYLCSQNFRVRLLTYQNMLVLFMRNLVLKNPETKDLIPPGSVSTFHSWFCKRTRVGFDTNNPPSAEFLHQHLKRIGMRQDTPAELLIDEGQDLPRCVYEAIPHYYERIFVGGDRAQMRHAHSSDPEKVIEPILQERYPLYKRYTLGQVFRSTYETFRFARQFVPKSNRDVWDENILEDLKNRNRRGRKPRVVTYRDPQQRDAHMARILKRDGNVAILCPIGAVAHARVSGESVEEMYDKITNMGFKATKYYNEMGEVPTSLRRYLCTTFISSAGLEFDTVIVPRMNFFRNPDYDKQTCIQAEMFVACTRAKGQLIIYRDMVPREYAGHPQYDPIANFDLDTYDAETVETQTATPGQQQPF